MRAQAVNELFGWGLNNSQLISQKPFILVPKRIGITNISKVACGTDIMAIIDTRGDLYIVGRPGHDKVWLSDCNQVSVVGPQNEILVLKNDATVFLIKNKDPVQLPFNDIVQIATSTSPGLPILMLNQAGQVFADNKKVTQIEKCVQISGCYMLGQSMRLYQINSTTPVL